MSTDIRTVGSGRPGAAASWLGSVAVAALAVAAVTVTAQSIDRFHWWAGFILVPGALIAATGGPLLMRGGGRAFGGYLVACIGTLVFTVGALLMFGAMGQGWPLMIILPSFAVAGTYGWHAVHPLARAAHRTVAMLALGGVALGATFLLIHAGRVDFGGTDWWGGFMMLAGVIVFLNAVELTRHRIPYRLQAITLLLGPAVITFLLGLRFLRGDWPY
ncbi:hypothetical protein [Micromonospora sp. NBC_01796]|uniref:hypothetical protein n=1 Tax=Micromonospora sp. NBC_01796 TaxID=2975987 RepID=UPI002DDB7798|nr:hypothetical protein [Micromonospora sp. NBC_01796]WSA89317.1 hypothetical protein OIE47_17875 [Micromonospora sp. NBC_01796]